MKRIDHETLTRWKNEDRTFQLIDVREPEEHADTNIGGILIPLDEISKRADELPEHIPLVFYCKRGIRSQIAIQRLARVRSTDQCYNLEGGLLALPGS